MKYLNNLRGADFDKTIYSFDTIYDKNSYSNKGRLQRKRFWEIYQIFPDTRSFDRLNFVFCVFYCR